MTEVEQFVPSLEVEFPYRESHREHHHQKPSGDLHLLMRRPNEDECFCIEHGPSAELAYMRHIHRKDEKLFDQLQRTREIMAQRANSIIDHICPDIDTKMDVLYAIDYAKRGHGTGSYKPLTPATDSKAGSPFPPVKIGMEELNAMNPDFYPYLPKLRKIVGPPRPLQFGVTSKSMSTLFPCCERGLTQYEQYYSIPGMTYMRNSRFYLEPQPTSRRRVNDFL